MNVVPQGFRRDKTCSSLAAIDDNSAHFCDRCILLMAMSRMKKISFLKKNAANDWLNRVKGNNQFYCQHIYKGNISI